MKGDLANFRFKNTNNLEMIELHGTILAHKSEGVQENGTILAHESEGGRRLTKIVQF